MKYLTSVIALLGYAAGVAAGTIPVLKYGTLLNACLQGGPNVVRCLLH